MAYLRSSLLSVSSFAALSAAVLIAAAPSVAEACSPPPEDGLSVQPLALDQPLHRDGALAFQVFDFDRNALDLDTELTLTVTLDDQEVAGAIEILDVLGGATDWQHEVIVLWRPAADLAASEDYQLSIAYFAGDEFGGDQTIEETFSVVDEAAPALDAVTATVSEELTIGEYQREFGERICCTMDDSCGPYAGCVTENTRESVSLRGDYDLGDAGARYTLIHPFSGVLGEAADAGYRILPGEEFPDGFVPVFDEAVGSYCVAFEAIDLLAGATIMSEPACIDAPPDLALAEAPYDVGAWAQNCTDEPVWESTGEPYEGPDTDSDTDGGSESDTDGGSESDTDGGSASESASESDSNSASESDTDGDSEGESEGQEGDSSGCSCTADGAPSPWALLGFLGFGALGFRRRR